jgi:hypothetical protein
MQTPTPFSSSLINIDALSSGVSVQRLASAVLSKKIGLFTVLSNIKAIADLSIAAEDHDAYHDGLVLNHIASEVEDKARFYGTELPPTNLSFFEHPHCPYMVPIFEHLNEPDGRVVGILLALVSFDRYVVDLLPDG